MTEREKETEIITKTDKQSTRQHEMHSQKKKRSPFTTFFRSAIAAFIGIKLNSLINIPNQPRDLFNVSTGLPVSKFAGHFDNAVAPSLTRELLRAST